MPWSDDVRVMLHPFRAYADLATTPDDEPPARTLALRVGLVLVVLGAFVSLTSAGRLVAFHVASTMIFWSFVPAVQGAAFVAALYAFAPKPSPARALALYFTGHGPWLVFLMLVAGVCLGASDVYAAFMWLLRSGVLPAMFGTVLVWSGVITYACFRGGVGLPRRRAAGATALFYAGFSGVIVGYYLAMNQIQPQLPWAR